MRTEETTRLSPNVPAQKIRDQFTGSFEGGSNYWLQSAKLMKADNVPTERPWYGCPAVFEGSFEIELGYDHPDGYEGEGKGRTVITDGDVRRGLDVMARDHPEQFAKVMSGNGDGDTADVFIQCALFGKVVYGCEAPKHCPYPPERQAEWDRWIAAKKKIVAAAQASKK